MRREFATDVAGLLINAYTPVFAALLLTSGALGDRFGSRRVFLLGLMVFTLASAACGLANSQVVLAVARLAQGRGAALLVPNSLSMLQQAFPNREQRSRAVGWWGALGGVSLAAFAVPLGVPVYGVAVLVRDVAATAASQASDRAVLALEERPEAISGLSRLSNTGMA